MPTDDVTRIMPHRTPDFGPPLAIISDIHANYPALRAVVDDIAAQGIDRVVCLGDVVGYGPDPVECWRLVSELCPIIIRGNHDQALAAGEMARFHPRARSAIEWTRGRLEREPDGTALIDTISGLPRSARDGQFLYVHGSPSNPTMEYLLPGDAYDRQRMAREFAEVDLFAFNGHSHIPGVIERGNRFMPPEALGGASYRLVHRQAIINVGSVGQPRDGNPKSCYLVIRDGIATYRRVAYDAEKVCKRILAIPELDPFLGQRLLAGY